eukprot:757774-Hanusia_phi.AAC.1
MAVDRNNAGEEQAGRRRGRWRIRKRGLSEEQGGAQSKHNDSQRTATTWTRCRRMGKGMTRMRRREGWVGERGGEGIRSTSYLQELPLVVKGDLEHDMLAEGKRIKLIQTHGCHLLSMRSGGGRKGGEAGHGQGEEEEEEEEESQCEGQGPGQESKIEERRKRG